MNQDRAEEGRHRARPITEPPGQGEERERLGHQGRVEIAADQPVIGERGARDEDAKDRGEVSGGAGAVKRPPEPVSGDREQHDLDEPEEQDRVGNADDQGQRGESAQIPVAHALAARVQEPVVGQERGIEHAAELDEVHELIAVVEHVAGVRGPRPREDGEGDGGGDRRALDHRPRRPAAAPRPGSTRPVITGEGILPGAPMAGGHASMDPCTDPQEASGRRLGLAQVVPRQQRAKISVAPGLSGAEPGLVDVFK